MNKENWVNHPKITPADMLLVKQNPPSLHNTQILLLREGDNQPRLGRWCQEGGYILQGWFGLVDQQPGDRWLDISELININQQPNRTH